MGNSEMGQLQDGEPVEELLGTGIIKVCFH